MRLSILWRIMEIEEGVITPSEKLIWMNNKTITDFGFHIIWRIKEISGVIRHGRNG